MDAVTPGGGDGRPGEDAGSDDSNAFADSTTSDDSITPVESTDAARTRIRERGERVRRVEQERALRRLRERRDLSCREEQIVRDLAGRLTEALLAVPSSTLDDVSEGEADAETARVALELFGEE